MGSRQFCLLPPISHSATENSSVGGGPSFWEQSSLHFAGFPQNFVIFPFKNWEYANNFNGEIWPTPECECSLKNKYYFVPFLSVFPF
jgi:hypothetical protein